MLGVQSIGTVITLLDRYGSIPILTYYWGLPLLGEWLLMRIVPTYLSMFEAGFPSAAGNKIVELLGENKQQDAANLYAVTSKIITTISITLMILVFLTLYLGSPKKWLNLQSLDHITIMTTILITSLNVILIFRTQLLYALYRSENHQVYWNCIIQLCRFSEFIMVALVSVLGGGVIALASAIMFTRLCAAVYLTLMAPKKVTLSNIKPNNTNWNLSKPLLKSGFGFMLIPLAQALNIQGFVWLIGNTLSPAMAAIFNIYRVYSRGIFQIGGITRQALWPELTVSYVKKDQISFGNLLLKSILWTLVISFLGCILSYFLADIILFHWTLGQVSNNSIIIGLLLGVSFLGTLRHLIFTASIAINKHTDLVTAEVFINLLAIIILYTFGLTSFFIVSSTLLMVDSIMLILVSAHVKKIVLNFKNI